MARARNIKPSFFLNERLAEIPPLGRLLFQALWCMADRAGRMEDRPKRIKVEALPYDDCDIDALLWALSRRGFIERYAVGDARFIQVVNFTKHQNPHVKEAASTIQAPDEHGASTVQAPEIPDAAVLIPDSGFRIPDSGFPLPDSSRTSGAFPTTPAKKPARVAGQERRDAAKNKPQAPTAATWDAYCNAYHDRYHVAPVRNATVNGQLASLVARIGGEEAPAVARFYVGHNALPYVRAGHSTGLLVRDAEKLRTEWATRRQITEHTARQVDATQTNANAFLPLIEEARERETNGAHHGK